MNALSHDGRIHARQEWLLWRNLGDTQRFSREATLLRQEIQQVRAQRRELDRQHAMGQRSSHYAGDRLLADFYQRSPGVPQNWGVEFRNRLARTGNQRAAVYARRGGYQSELVVYEDLLAGLATALQNDMRLAGFYWDLSPPSARRPGINCLMQDVADGAIDIVLARDYGSLLGHWGPTEDRAHLLALEPITKLTESFRLDHLTRALVQAGWARDPADGPAGETELKEFCRPGELLKARHWSPRTDTSSGVLPEYAFDFKELRAHISEGEASGYYMFRLQASPGDLVEVIHTTEDADREERRLVDTWREAGRNLDELPELPDHQTSAYLVASNGLPASITHLDARVREGYLHEEEPGFGELEELLRASGRDSHRVRDQGTTDGIRGNDPRSQSTRRSGQSTSRSTTRHGSSSISNNPR